MEYLIPVQWYVNFAQFRGMEDYKYDGVKADRFSCVLYCNSSSRKVDGMQERHDRPHRMFILLLGTYGVNR